MTTPDQIRTRRNLYGGRAGIWQTPAVRASVVPSMLADQPEFKKLAAERAQLRDAEMRHIRLNQEAWNEFNLRKAEWEQEKVRLLLAGEPAPNPPTEPVIADYESNGETSTWRLFMAPFDEAHRSIEAAERALLVDEADRWFQVLWAPLQATQAKVEKARAVLADAERKAAPVVAQVEQINALLQSVGSEGAPSIAMSIDERTDDGVVRRHQGVRQHAAQVGELMTPEPSRFPTLRRGR